MDCAVSKMFYAQFRNKKFLQHIINLFSTKSRRKIRLRDGGKHVISQRPRNLKTKGEEGWDPDKKQGTVWHWRSSELIQKSINESSWRTVGFTSGVHECLSFLSQFLVSFSFSSISGYVNTGQTSTLKRNRTY